MVRSPITMRVRIAIVVVIGGATGGERGDNGEQKQDQPTHDFHLSVNTSPRCWTPHFGLVRDEALASRHWPRAQVELHHGYHQYLFLVESEPSLDPNAHGIARNARGEPVSLIAVS